MSNFISPMASFESLSTDLIEWSIGPYHAALPGMFRMMVQLDGEIIVCARVDTGFLHRGLEKALELHAWQSAIVYADRVDPENAIVAELAVCHAVEEIGGFPVPERAVMIRLILCELSRISSHLANIARMARVVESETALHFALRDRERALDLFELLTGARFAINYLRYGGVAADVTDGFLERVSEFCDQMRGRIREYNDLLTYHKVFVNRTRGVGNISKAVALNFGLTGPVARASGVETDLRKTAAQYMSLDFEIQYGGGAEADVGDSFDRFILRVREIAQSVRILKQAVEKVPSGPFSELICGRDFSLIQGEAYSRIEGPRGILGCYTYSSGGSRPGRMQFKTPSLAVLSALPRFVVGMRREDLPVFLASLDLSISEVDR